MSRDDGNRYYDWKRVSTMAGVDENGLILPPPAGETISQEPNPYWKTKDYGMSETPADVMKIAVDALYDAEKRKLIDPSQVSILVAAVIARAIMAERERCARVIENWRGDLVPGEIIQNAIDRLADHVRRGNL